MTDPDDGPTLAECERDEAVPCAWCVVQCQHEDDEDLPGCPCKPCREQPLAPDHPACLESYEAYRAEVAATEPF